MTLSAGKEARIVEPFSKPAQAVYAWTNQRLQARPWLMDLVVFLVFLAFATLFHLGRYYQAPEIFNLSSDAANIASFAAAWDHPELFEGDMILGNPKNFRFYATVHIPLVSLLQRVTGHYGSAFAVMIGPHILLHLVGFYLLGRVLFKSRFWAFFLAWALSANVNIGLSEFWGLFPDPLPRVSFSAGLGFLWAAALYWRQRPSAWPWIMAASGLLMYVHPVSAPTIALAVWMGLWTYKPESWSPVKRWGYLIFCGVCFLAVAAPFLVNYLANHEHGPVANLEQVRQIMRFRFARGYMVDEAWAIQQFGWRFCLVTPLLPLGLLGTILLLGMGNEEERSTLYLFLVWMLGIAISSIGLFLFDHKIAQLTGRIPFEADLIRGIRFLVPLFLILFIWSLRVMGDRIEGRLGSRLALVGLMALSFIMIRKTDLYLALPQTAAKKILLGKKAAEVNPPSQAIMAIRRLTPPKARILAYDIDQLAIRYGALRPVVYCGKDGGALAYSNHAALLKWYEMNKIYQGIKPHEDPIIRSNLLLMLAHTLEAEYLVINLAEIPSDNFSDAGKIIWSNQHYCLIHLSGK